MIVRLRYIGKDRDFLKKDKVYYFEYSQSHTLRITLISLPHKDRVVTLPNLEALLDQFKILTIKKELKNA
jgi:hypothetical protein